MTKSYHQLNIGYIYALAAITAWGLMPLYWVAIANLPPTIVLAHRTIWSAIIMLIILTIMRKLKVFINAIRQPKIIFTLGCAGLLLGTNWLIFLDAVQQRKIIESSLGYYINPLFTVFLGMIIFRERLKPLQMLAFIIMIITVIYQAIGLAHIPWHALSLAATFSTYSVIKKQVRLDGLVSLTIESMLISPLMMIYLASYLLQSNTPAAIFGDATGIETLFLIGAGFATAIPLVWFSNAARRLPLTTLGFLNFIAPTLSLLLAIFVFKEPFTVTHKISFAILGIALCLYAYDLIQTRKIPSLQH